MAGPTCQPAVNVVGQVTSGCQNRFSRISIPGGVDSTRRRADPQVRCKADVTGDIHVHGDSAHGQMKDLSSFRISEWIACSHGEALVT